MGACNCPAPTTMTAIPDSDCEVHIKQIQKYIFQRAGFEFDAAALPTPMDINDLSVWQDLQTAIDDTKVVGTPFIGSDPKIEAGQPITTGGGDNTTLNGIEEITGSNPSKSSTMFYGLTSAQETALKKLMCEKKLVVFMVNEDDQILAKKTGTDKYTGFPVQSLFVGDKNNAGFGTKDTNLLQFSMKEGWSENMELVAVTGWSPLAEL